MSSNLVEAIKYTHDALNSPVLLGYLDQSHARIEQAKKYLSSTKLETVDETDRGV